MASPKFPEPPPSIAPTSIEEAERILERLYERRSAWVACDIPRRIELLERCIQNTLEAAKHWVEAAASAKGISTGDPRAGEEWLGGPMTVVRNLRLLIESLRADGAPKPPKVWTRSDGQVVAQVFPANTIDSALFGGFVGEVWMEPGKSASQGRLYREKRAGNVSEGGVALVLGAGNVASIGPMDALYKLIVDDEVVLVKTNPVNAYLGPFWEEAFEPLRREGFFAVVHGGAELGAHLVHHERVHSVHITGSDRTHDAIVWGTDPEEVERRKAENDPLLTKEITSELGCVTPVFVVPGPWSESDIEFQARHVAGMVANNGSFNCNAAKVLLLARGWPQKDAFLAALRRRLQSLPPRKAYYPGAQERYDAFVEQYPQADPLGERTEQIVPWTLIPDVKPEEGEYALTNEAFCGVLALVEIDATDAPDYLEKAVPFANDHIWGTLSCMMLVHPSTEKQFGEAVDAAVANLRYGGIGVNVWAGVIYGLVVTTWGAFPGHPLEDIRSGRGVVHNTYLFDHPQKSVLRAPFRIRPTPAWFGDHRNQEELGRRLTAFEANPSLLRLPKVVAAALRG
ncbi:MAG: aldehyde dehydrogenase family protein [Deltaproteobacteria bacterium]|nr:MAG: aldehyde dehydrogenase family protein [Deltaproteobacteria bacterium]